MTDADLLRAAEQWLWTDTEDGTTPREAAAVALAHWVRDLLDPAPIDAAFLESLGFSDAGINGVSILLPPVEDGTAIAELYIGEDGMVSLSQGVPDDQHRPSDVVLLTSLPPVRTRGQVRGLLRGLGIAVKGA